MHKYGDFSAKAWVDSIIRIAEGSKKPDDVEIKTVEVKMDIDSDFHAVAWAQSIIAKANIQVQ